ncbi:MAG: Smr/MutS family protein [Deltaproteobacteria bacterium]|nr:Smr/MutS family protein [Deltaproteobacteria bacterium]
MGKKKHEGFNSPFADLSKRLKEDEEPAKAEPVPPPPPAPSASEPEDDAALFEQWVGEVRPLEGRERQLRARPEPKLAEALQDAEDAEALAVLSDLVGGRGEFDLSDTEEWVEGLAPGIDRKLLRRLKRGDFSVQGHLDLHGLVREAAQVEVRRFIRDSRGQGKRCVLIIPGRGKGSPDGEPVLKKALVRWLSRGELGRQVLAFCTARPGDGGAGALYVLLRR